MGLISNGTTIFDNGAMAVGGSMTFISSATASSSASIEFTLGDYKEYKFFFVNIHGSTTYSGGLSFQVSTDSGSTYATTVTSTSFRAYHWENDNAASLDYRTGEDEAQTTNFVKLMVYDNPGVNNDDCGAGYLQLFNPSSTTYVKHFIANTNDIINSTSQMTHNRYAAGYFNTTSALTNIKFKMLDSGNIDDGKILMFGLN